MAIKYVKKLAYSESSRHFVRVLVNFRNIFPEPHIPFTVIVNGQRIEVVLDSSFRIWASLFWKKLPRFRAGDTIIFSKNNDNSYTVTVEKGRAFERNKL